MANHFTKRNHELLGEIYKLSLNNASIEVCQVGATLKSLVLNGNEILMGFSDSEIPLFGQGQVLFPFPNRISDGKYLYNGEVLQLPINEVPLNNSIHGLVRWQKWELINHLESSITFKTETIAQPGYPFCVEILLTYSLINSASFYAHFKITNRTKIPVLAGVGFHPYFKLTSPIDELILHIPAKSYYLLNERKIPIDTKSLKKTSKDFAIEKPIGSLQLDDCYSELEYNHNDLARITLKDPRAKKAIYLDVTNHFNHIMVFTADSLKGEFKRNAIAIEPMTCPPNAFNWCPDKVTLLPGTSKTASFRITYVDI
jgi:aldose 1-epimerase